MLIGKGGHITPEQQALVEQQAEAQRQAALRSQQEEKRVKSLSNENLAGELRIALRKASKLTGPVLHNGKPPAVNGVPVNQVPTNGLEVAYILANLMVLRRDRNVALRLGNDPYCLVTPKRPKRGRVRNWPKRIAAAAAKKTA